MIEDAVALEDIWEQRHGERDIVRTMVIAWHRSQDGLVHWCDKTIENTLMTFKTGPRTDQSFYTTQYHTLCGWVVCAMPENGEPKPRAPAFVTCLDCIAKDIPHGR